MNLVLLPKEPSWWIWLATALLLVAGLVWTEVAFVGAILLSAAQTGFHLRKHDSYAPHAVQILVAYTALLIVCFAPFMRWLYWLPTLGTFALILFGYCLMARVLSLMPWNRTGSLTFDLARRTFLTPPVIGNAAHGLPDSGCMGGVCALEAQVAAPQNR